MQTHDALWGYLFLLPWVLGLVIFIAYPVLATFYLSFAEYNIIQPPRWIGLQNYQGVQHQEILTFNYEITPYRAWGGRVVVNNGDVNF